MWKELKARLIDWIIEAIREHKMVFGLGIIVGLAIVVTVTYLKFGEAISNYEDIGSFMGEYEVARGNYTTVSTDELGLFFHTYNHPSDSSGNVKHTKTTFPRFKLGGLTISKMKIGRRLTINSNIYSYTVDLTRIEIHPTDTIAYFNVHRKEYPENRKASKP